VARARAVKKRQGPALSLSRRLGDEYQDIYGWFRALDLLRPAREVLRVSIEDPAGGFFDDVTIRTRSGSRHAPEFAQVKFHVDLAGAYSTDLFMSTKSKNGRSLLRKAWDTWSFLRSDYPNVELVLVSTHSWDPDDAIASHIRYGEVLTRDFVAGSLTGAPAESRRRWHVHLDQPEEADFRSFLASLRFRVGFPATGQLLRMTADQMELVGLKHEEADIKLGAQQVFEWIKEGKSEITAEDVTAAIDKLDLRDPSASPDRAVALYIHTIRKEPLETAADWDLDWREHFEGDEWLRGHGVHDPEVWNTTMLPELLRTRDEMSSKIGARLLRVAGKARLSAWFAIGWTFSPVAGWALEVDQNGAWWRNDAAESADVELVAALEDAKGPADVLAVGVSLTGDLSADVRQYLAEIGEPAGKILFVQTNLGLGKTIRGPGDLTKLAHLLRDQMRGALGRRPARILLFYMGPLAGAAFVGAALNAIAAEVQIYEDQLSGYAPSFTFVQT